MDQKFICILGIDGSGKSTLALNLIEYFQNNQKHFNYVWGGCHHYITLPFVIIGKKIFLNNTDQYRDYDDYCKKIDVPTQITFFKKAYHLLLFIDYFIQVSFKISLPLLFGQKIITDRYIFGTIIDMAIILKYKDNKIMKSINQLLQICPKPEIIFYIDIPEERAFIRKDDIPSIEYLKVRRNHYLHLLRGYNVICLDGLKSPEELKYIAVSAMENR